MDYLLYKSKSKRIEDFFIKRVMFTFDLLSLVLFLFCPSNFESFHFGSLRLLRFQKCQNP
jgi:hypothetical protein